ncbi:MAG: hypothetical protein FWF92_10945 [Oscillospiraceae bacterium]|nr:hypothetical protein [Oscillospiraceae bacterium]
MKKIIIILFVFTLIFTMFSCADKTETVNLVNPTNGGSDNNNTVNNNVSDNDSTPDSKTDSNSPEDSVIPDDKNDELSQIEQINYSPSISVSQYHNLATKNDGSLWAWGWNYYGQLGDGTTDRQSIPVKIMDGVMAACAGDNHSLAIKSDGSLWTWGLNNYGQLGDGTTEDKLTPIKIMDDVTAVNAGGGYSLAIKSDGSLWTWGLNYYGRLGDGTTEDKLTPIKIMDDVKEAIAGNKHSLAIKNDGSLWAWGNNNFGSLGDGTIGTNESKSTPVKIMDDVIAISAGGQNNGDHSFAIKSDGSLWAWGNNSYGQLGNGEIKDYNPTPVKIMDGVMAISAGDLHSFAIKNDGSLWGWGNNSGGRLGDGTFTIPDKENNDKTTPIKIMDDVTAISAGPHSLAIKNDGSLWVWGINMYGSLGDGTDEDRETPVKIMDGMN